MPIGFECGGANAISSCGGGPRYDDPGQSDDGSFHEGEDPDTHLPGNGSKIAPAEILSGEMEPAPARFGYEQRDVDMDGEPEY